MQLQKPATHPNHIPALDGLRGIAIILVIAWHYLPFLQPWFPGWIGVDLFFVLSGYLITWRLTATRGQPHYFSRFYRNRALRIIPLCYTLVIGFLLCIHLLVHPKNLPTVAIYTIHWKSFLIFTENWTFIFFGLPINFSLVPLWSIAVEEQFYLIWPLIIFLLPTIKSRTTTFLLLILAVAATRTTWYLTHPYAPLLYYNTFFRIDSFAVGGLLYQLHESRTKLAPILVAWMMTGLLAILLFNNLSLRIPTPGDPFMMTLGYTLLALFFACALDLAAREEKNAFSIFLSSKFLRGAGRISYCLYLIHFPISEVVASKLHGYALTHWPNRLTLVSAASISISLLLSCLLSILSYRYLESWFLKYKAPDPSSHVKKINFEP